jgi:hypothetical protein
MDTGDSLPGQKRVEREADYLHHSIIMLRVGGSIPPLLTRLCGVQRHKCTFKVEKFNIKRK